MMLDRSQLSTEERVALQDDIEGLAADEHLSWGAAEQVLEHRIGGQSGLRGYVACLMMAQRERAVLAEWED